MISILFIISTLIIKNVITVMIRCLHDYQRVNLNNSDNDCDNSHQNYSRHWQPLLLLFIL